MKISGIFRKKLILKKSEARWFLFWLLKYAKVSIVAVKGKKKVRKVEENFSGPSEVDP